MQLRRSFLIAGAILLMLASSTLTVTISSPAEVTESTDDPDSSSTNRDSSIETPTVSLAEIRGRTVAPVAIPKAVKALNLSKYRIRPGDTLGKVANLWHMSVSKLACRNGISNPNLIFPGMLIDKNGKKCHPATAPMRVHGDVPVKSSSNVETVISFAIAQIGEPYVYGAAGPDTWDCSGLVLKAFEQVGISLPHYTGAMIGYGTPVSQSSLQRGDIVFPEKGHVGIYVGDGQYINAPQSGDVVKIAPVYAFYAARRLL